MHALRSAKPSVQPARLWNPTETSPVFLLHFPSIVHTPPAFSCGHNSAGCHGSDQNQPVKVTNIIFGPFPGSAIAKKRAPHALLIFYAAIHMVAGYRLPGVEILLVTQHEEEIAMPWNLMPRPAARTSSGASR